MKNLVRRLKQKFRSNDDDAKPANQSPSSELTALPTQATNAAAHLTESPVDQSGNSGNTLVDSTPTAPPTQELSTVSLEEASSDPATSMSLSERLWIKAYDDLKDKESDLVEAYEKILLKVQTDWAEVTPPKVDTLQHCKSDKSRQMWMMVYTGLERSKRQAEHKDTASNVIETINNIKVLIDKAVKYSAEATVVWVGVSLGLEILLNPMKEPGLNRKAIAYVLSKMEWYWNLTDAALGQENALSPSMPSHALRSNLEIQLVDFYKKLLMFQMRSACLYYRNWASILLRDMVKLDDWSGKLVELKDSEAAIRRDIKQFNSEEVKCKLAGIENNSTLQGESLENIYSAIREEARVREKNERDDKEKDCLRALHVTDPQFDKQRIQNQKRGPLTQSCDWVFASTAYEQFIADNSNRILWISGLPGKGKTMLACGTIDKLRESLRPLAFFFCEASTAKDNLSDETRSIRGLLYMLLDYQPSLMPILRPYYEKMGETLFNNINSSIILVEILAKMLQDSSLHEAIIVIDALDECDGRSHLINAINDLSKSCPTKWILTSRPWPEIKTELSAAQGLISLNLEDEKESVSEAVKSYITTTVDDLAKKWGDDAELKATISEYMYSHADNTFLWVSLVCQKLASSSIPKRRVLDELKKFPATLDDLYHAMMERIMKSGEEDRLTQILATVCITYRRLTPAELATLMGDMKEDDVADAITWCGSFLDYQNGEIFLIHQSARDFLLNKVPEKILPGGIELQHHSMFLKSLEALSAILEQDIYGLDAEELTGLAGHQIPAPIPDPLAPIRYSCVYWVDHLKNSRPQGGTGGRELQDNGIVHKFFQTKYLNWLEALSLLCRVSEGILAVQNLEALAEHTQSVRLGELLHDARRFVLSHKPAIEIAPLQVYASALVFSPTRSLIKQLYENELSIRIIPPTAVGLDWNACLQTMEHNASALGCWLWSVCFSADGQWLASGSGIDLDTRAANVKVWSTSTGQCLQVLEGHESSVQAVAFSPNNLLLASGSNDSTVRIWNPITGECTNVLHGHDDKVTSLSFSPDSTKVASGSSDGTVKVWHAATGTCFRTLNESHQAIDSVAFLSGNGRLASVTRGVGVHFWNVSTGRLESTVEYDGEVIGTAFAANYLQLVTASQVNILKIWGLVPNQCLHTIHTYNPVDLVALSSDGTRLASASNRKIDIWDTHTGQHLQTLKGNSGYISSLAFTFNGTQLASGDTNGTIKIWDLIDSPNLPIEIRQESPSKVIGHIRVLSNSICLSAGFYVSALKVWDRNTGACLRVFGTHKADVIRTLLLSSDGTRVASASVDGCISIWDVSMGSQTQKFKGEYGGITSAVFPSDDAFLVSGSAGGVIQIWNPVTGTCLQTFGDCCNSSVELLAITPDNMRVASVFADNSLSIWDVASGLCRCNIQQDDLCTMQEDSYKNDLVSVAFSCDSKRLALGLASGPIFIINGQDGSDRQALHDKNDSWGCCVKVLAFSPDNTMLASASMNVRVWDISAKTCLYSIYSPVHTQLSWDPHNDSRLQTDFGDFDITRFPTEQSSQSATEVVLAGFGISSDGAWILGQGKPMLWLPPEFRAKVAAVRDSDVFIGSWPGLFYWLRFPAR